jgi:hypothetical protein
MQTAKTLPIGHPPKVVIGEVKKKPVTEQEKYEKCWNVDAYRKISPGERAVPMFLEACEAFDDSLVKMDLVDIGAGTGRGGHAIWKELGIPVTLMDFALNCLDEEVRADVEKSDTLDFVQHDISEKTNLRRSLGFCVDVLEHIPPEQIDTVLTNIFEMCTNVFFSIATIPDVMGGHEDIQEDLHLTVWPYQRWLKKFAEFGVTVHRSAEHRHHVVFFTSGWCGFPIDKMKMNNPPEEIWAHMRENFSLGLKQVRVFEEQPDQRVAVLAGGPSLNEHVDQIKKLKEDGAKIVTVNNAYNWAKEHDWWPVNQVMIDSREFNKRFVEDVDERNTYFMCSQVNPEIVKSLPPEKTWLFHANLDPTSVSIIEECVGEAYKDWYPIPGGSTVVMRTLPLLITLGFRQADLFGFDSCIGGAPVGDFIDFENHHAYPQPENDIHAEKSAVAVVRLDTKKNLDEHRAFEMNHDELKKEAFAVQPWHVTQLMEYFSYGMQAILKPLKVTVHGDGLIAHCAKNGLEILDPLDLTEEL